ncbi:NAD+ synthase [cyanobacterium TDX16]|nr:NAD+ synthase [cyanobacterium TDX16]
MKVALAQINPIVGDVAGNCRRVVEAVRRAAEAGAELVLLPELTICGYPPKDLLLKPRFIEANVAALRQLAAELRDGPAVLVGYVRPSEKPVGRRVRNCLALLRGGEIVSEACKSLLPTYDVFDEHRYFEPADGASVVELKSGGRTWRIGVTICEDLWNDKQTLGHQLYEKSPIHELQKANVDFVVNASASPFTVGKQALRERLMGGQAKLLGRPIVYVNQVGGNDELIFDGSSCVFDGQGAVAARAAAFEESIIVVDLAKVAGAVKEEYPSDHDSVYQALVLGTRDYVRKCGFSDVVIGLSGGIDSALTACVAVEALGADRVHGVAMPSRFSSDHSLADAEALARNLGIDFQTIAIEPMHAAMEGALQVPFRGRSPDITEENVQARIRGNILMSLSNKFGWLLLTTGNKSELAVGYCTLYGDMCGGLAVISDVPKTMVYELSHRFNRLKGREVIPDSSLTKLPSAELRPDQHDQQSLPPYDTLDAILQRYVEKEESAADIIHQGFDEAVVRDVIRKVDRNEYKRKQAATGLKVTSRAFGVGRRMPIAAKFPT